MSKRTMKAMTKAASESQMAMLTIAATRLTGLPWHMISWALARLHVLPEQCLFVGDDPRWDWAGARGLGMEAILIDRQGTGQNAPAQPIRDLQELLRMIRE